jgi:uncharacterized protein
MLTRRDLNSRPNENIRSFRIDINLLDKRELAELIIQYYSGGELNELQVTGIERLIDELETRVDIGEDDFRTIFTDDIIFERADTRLTDLKNRGEIHSGSAAAIKRAFQKFRELHNEFDLLRETNALSRTFIDDLTRNRGLAIIDFSADGAPGASLQLKQIIVSYFSILLSRTFMEYKSRGRRRYMMFIIEECQNYIPNISTYNVGSSLARQKLSLIATQGRKFGISLCLISQRPSFVDPVVLSMCNSFFIHRISPEDTSFVEKVSGGLPANLKRRLTSLRKGTCIAMGQMSNKLPFPIMIDIPAKEVPHTAGTTDVLHDLVGVSNHDADTEV